MLRKLKFLLLTENFNVLYKTKRHLKPHVVSLIIYKEMFCHLQIYGYFSSILLNCNINQSTRQNNSLKYEAKLFCASHNHQMVKDDDYG